MRVLLVDDSGVMRKIIARGLNALWIKDVDEAADGVEALQKFGDGTEHNLVITDWNMPNMNGLELVEAIRASGSKVPILMVTTETQRGQVIKAIQAGVNDYLPKPFSQELLMLKLERVLPKPQEV